MILGHELRGDSPLLGRLNVTSIAFQLHLRNAVERQSHLLEPSFDVSSDGSFHHTYHLAFSQICEAAITFHRRILLGCLRELTKLIGRKLSGWNRMRCS
jgi:hypothetical protein